MTDQAKLTREEREEYLRRNGIEKMSAEDQKVFREQFADDEEIRHAIALGF